MRAWTPQRLAVLLTASLGAPYVAGTAVASPPRFTVSVPHGPFTFVVYGDTRFTRLPDVVNSTARRALVDGIAREHPVAVLIGGDLVYQGSDPDDYAVYRGDTAAWSARGIPVFPALGNHEFKGCGNDRGEGEVGRCLENWWSAFSELPLRPSRWYSVAIGPTLLAVVLDSSAALAPGSEQREWFEQQLTHTDPQVRFVLVLLHYPPVRDPLFPRMRDEQEVARFLARSAAGLRARVVVVGSHVHNYERYARNGITYLVSGGGGARPHPAFRMFGELSQLATRVNFHYLRFTLDGEHLRAVMVRFEADEPHGWSEPDRFAISARGNAPAPAP